MGNELAPTAPKNQLQLGAEERALLLNDLSKLNEEQRASLYNKVCESIGLNPLTQPFGYIQLGGKLVLYAQKNCTDQIRFIHNVTVELTRTEKQGDIYLVSARASMPNGRKDESTGAVSIKGLGGDNLANALMKAETKAKRRVTLSICGLSFLDETEVETIKDAKIVSEIKPQAQLSEKPVDERALERAFMQAPDAQFENDPLDRALGGPGDYKITFGKHAGKAFKSFHPEDLREYCEGLEERAMAEGKEITKGGAVDLMLNEAIKYLNSIKGGR